MPLKMAVLSGIFAALWVVGSLAEARVPTGGWVVSFDDAQCLAFRDYGTKEAPIQLLMKTPPVGGVVQLAIARKGSPIQAAQVKGTLGIDDRAPTRISMLAYSPEGSGLRVYTMNIPAGEFALVRQAKEIEIRSGSLQENFLLTNMTALLKTIDDCVADLRRVFNVIDPQTAEKSPLKRRATARLGNLIDSDDYPRDALYGNQGGKVTFALLIDEKGKVADCSVIETSDVAVLDAQSCILLSKRARFEPALGPDGKPAKDALTAAIVWRMAY